jgi:hypothetical protein
MWSSPAVLSRHPSKMLLTPEQPSNYTELKPEYHCARARTPETGSDGVLVRRLLACCC